MRKLITSLCMLMFCALTYAQTRTVTGKVTDAQGKPVPYATVTVKGTKIITQTDEQGNFTIKAGSGNVLNVTYQGQQQDYAVGTSDIMSISFNHQAQNLTEVVVTTALGLKREARELGYASTSIGNKYLTQGKAVNVQQALNGKVSGVSITTVNSGVFENAKINIRGIRSLTGNNQPMLVVDGAPTPLSYMSSIPPDDIQDLTVLKSAASAALYGPDAVNGVIVITTKKGSGNQLSVSLNSSVQLARVAFFPKMQKTFGGGGGEIVDQYGNWGFVPYENQQFGPAFDGSTKEIGVHIQDGSVQTGPYTNAHFNDKINFWNTGLTIQNSISITGQDFYVSAEDAKIKGLMPNDENRRTSFRFNGGKKYNKFSINYGLNYITQKYSTVDENSMKNYGTNSYVGSIFFLVMQTPSNIPLLSYKNWRTDKWAMFDNYYNEFALNPYWAIDNMRLNGREDDLIGNVDASYQVAPWLKGTVRLSSNLAFSNYDDINAPVTVSDWTAANRNKTQYQTRLGKVINDENYASRINLDYFLSGDRNLNSNFNIRYVAGGAVRQNTAKDVAVGGNNLVVPYLYNVSARSGDAIVPQFVGGSGPVGNNYNITSRLLSAYGTVGFGYKGFAFIEATGRNDWDSRLLEKNRSFFYPAANASIVLSDAIPALKNSSLINYAKVRAAYSKSGNVNIPVYSLQSTYSQGGGFPYGNIPGFTSNTVIPNPDLKPEFVTTKEAGIELGLLHNRINIEATYFYQNCNNQILNVSQSSATGYTVGIANAANFNNYGVEMDLGLSPLIKLGKGRFDLKLNATYNNNVVVNTLNNIPVVIGGTSGFLQNSGGSPSASNVAVVGMPAFAFQLTDYKRDPQGHVIVDSKTGMPSQADGEVTLGRSLPLWIVGITPSYSIGNLNVSMTWDYKGGHYFYAGIGSDEDFAGISARSAEYNRQRFVFPNSVYWDGSKYVPNTNIQVQDGNAGFWANASSNEAIATNYFASASAWRLREVNVSYTLPSKWIGNGRMIKRVTISAIAKNLLLLVPKSNEWGDPEFNYSSTNNTYGISSSFQSPASRLYGGSLTVQF